MGICKAKILDIDIENMVITLDWHLENPVLPMKEPESEINEQPENMYKKVLRYLMDSNNLTRKDFCIKTSISSGRLSEYINGIAVPSETTWIKILSVFGEYDLILQYTKGLDNGI
jgi:hypothetical protein